MTEPLFEPRLLTDGSLDPDSLERMGPDRLTDWMRNRLGGRDPWFPLDRRSDEDPEMIYVGLLRGIGSGHPLVPLLGRAARRLLDEAAAAAPSSPPWFRPLLRLCQQAALPATGAWFAAELERLAEKPESFASRWPERDLAGEILFAALRQSPGWPGSPARPAWEALLARPETTTFALSALGTSLQQQVAHLRAWWEACPQEERDLELSQLIFEALTAEGAEAARGSHTGRSSLSSGVANGHRPGVAGPRRTSGLHRRTAAFSKSSESPAELRVRSKTSSPERRLRREPLAGADRPHPSCHLLLLQGRRGADVGPGQHGPRPGS